MSSELLVELLKTVQDGRQQHAYLERYATGRQPQAFLSEASRKALDHQLGRMVVNIPALAISSLTERLRVTGYSDSRAWDLFVASDLDQLASQAMADALTYSAGFVLVWAKDGKPVASVERPNQVAVLRDPADRSVVAAVKAYSTRTTSEAYLFLPDEVQHWRSDVPNAAPTSPYYLVDSVPNPLGVVPMVEIENGRSEITDLIPLVDALSKVLLDMVIGSHAAGFGRRWVTGLELDERPVLDGDGNPVLDENGQPLVEVVNPISELSSVPMAVAEGAETKFGSFSEPTLSGFETAVRVLLSQVMAVSALPSHYLGILSNQPTSADALRASEASLTARAEQRQLTFGRSWEQVGRLLIAVDTGVDPSTVPLRVSWADASTRSVAQDADAAVKLFQSGLLSRRATLRRLGFSDDEIAAELDAIDHDAAQSRDITVGRYMAGTRVA